MPPPGAVPKHSHPQERGGIEPQAPGCCDTQLSHRLFTGWLGNSLEHGCITAVEMTSLGELLKLPHLPQLSDILTRLDRMVGVPGQMFEVQSLSALAGVRGRGVRSVRFRVNPTQPLDKY